MIQIQNTVAPFPVGIGKVVGASGTADEKVFDTKSVEGSDILTDKSPFEKQSRLAPASWAAARLVPERS